MDTVELARRRAARIHQSAVDSGATPENPYALVEWIAAQRDLTIEKCEPGSAFLDGGRACYVPSVALIVHEKCSSEFEEAFLVAHELGHVELGDAKTGNVTIQADLTRGAEESPVGENRVAGYGIRQRRERQMDLFARELLLPRKALRNLYLQDGMSAAEISRRLNAPFATVAQQLLDALLLPEPAETSPAAPQPRTPNDEQRNAAKHRGAAYLLEAGPGTGKTECLILRVEHLVAEGTDPRRILLLTFSNKAAMEMGDRIASRLPGAAAAMWIGTFHAFGLDILRRFHREMGFEPEPKLIDRAEAAGLLEAEFPRLALTHYRDIRDPTDKILELLQAISRAKDEVTDPADYGRLVAAMAANVRSEDDRLRAAKADEVARVYAEYEQLKQARSLVDFGDLVMLPVKLCDRNGQVRQLLSAEYDHVLVDEYQDVNRSSVRLLSALRSEGRNLWVVGDSRQSIYRFRGASSVNLRQFGKEDFDGGVRAALVRNYRSTSEVLDSFVSFGQTMEGHSDLNLLSNRGGSGLRPQLIVTRRHAQKIGALAEQIRAMRSAGYMFRDQAVLCSGNETVARTARELERLGLPVLFLGNLFDRDEVKELLAFLSLLVDKRAAGLIRVGCMPQFAMELGDVASVLSEMRARPAESPSWLDDPSFATVAKSASNALERIKEALAGFSAHSTPWAVLVNLLLERTRLAARIAESTHISDRARGIAIWQLLNFVRTQGAGPGFPVTRLLEKIRRTLRFGDERDLRQLPDAAQGIDAVRLMTIHGAKGLEFGVVHIPTINSGSLPVAMRTEPCPPPDGMIAGGDGRGESAAHDADQQCLFYVALSRARDRLFLYAAAEKSHGKKWSLSPFVERLGESITRSDIEPSEAAKASADEEPINVKIDGILGVTASQLALYGKCPRRFFYTHVLSAGGRRTSTPYMQLHEAVRSICNASISADAGEDDARLEEALAKEGLATHGYLREFKDLARSMIRYFRSIRSNHTPEKPALLRVALGGEAVLVMPDDVLVRHDGTRLFRSVRTGHRRSTDAESVDAAAFVLAAQRAFPGATVELVNLADLDSPTTVELSAKQLKHREEKITRLLADIRAGNFPTNPSERTCPGCPAFFICGPVPSGALTKKTEELLPSGSVARG